MYFSSVCDITLARRDEFIKTNARMVGGVTVSVVVRKIRHTGHNLRNMNS